MAIRQGQMLARDTHVSKKLQGILISILESVVDLLHIAEIDQPLRTRDTGHMSHKGKFFYKTWAIAVDDSILFRMKTATVSSYISITAVRQACRIAIVTHGENLTKIRTGDHGPDIQPHAARAPRQTKSEIHINFFKFRSHGEPPRNLRAEC